jgi:hypothetical protein
MRGSLILHKTFLWIYFNIIFSMLDYYSEGFFGSRWNFLKIFFHAKYIFVFSSSSSNPTSCSRIQYTKLLTVQYSVCYSYFYWFLNIYFIYLFSSTILNFFFYIWSLLSFSFISNLEEKLQLSVGRFNCR